MVEHVCVLLKVVGNQLFDRKTKRTLLENIELEQDELKNMCSTSLSRCINSYFVIYVDVNVNGFFGFLWETFVTTYFHLLL